MPTACYSFSEFKKKEEEKKNRRETQQNSLALRSYLPFFLNLISLKSTEICLFVRFLTQAATAKKKSRENKKTLMQFLYPMLQQHKVKNPAGLLNNRGCHTI